MYAIFEDGSRQYKVAKGDSLEVDDRQITAGDDEITFDRVLLVRDENGTRVGAPLVDGATVVATVNGHIKGEKLDVIKFRRRKGYRRKTGFRGKYLSITVKEISG